MAEVRAKDGGTSLASDVPRGTAVGARVSPGDPALARRLARQTTAEVLFDPFSRGRYATDASIYQIEPLGVVVPRTREDLRIVMEIAREAGVPVLPRGGGSSQCGQTVGEALVVDTSKYLDAILEFDTEAGTALVEPGLALDRLNARLAPHGWVFPVDVSTSSRATLGGMAGNNSCGSRSIVYGTMRDNVRAIEAILADGSALRFGPLDNVRKVGPANGHGALVEGLLELGRREAGEIAARFPAVSRRVGGYNLDALAGNEPPNLAHLLVGSEGTLALSSAIELRLSRPPAHRVLGVCHFPTFYRAMEAPQHLVELGPSAVELVDRTMIQLSREIAEFSGTVAQFVRGDPAALLLVEFAGEDRDALLRDLKRLDDLMGELGLPGAVVEAVEPAFQKAVWEVRKAGLNIMMSMKGEGKPVSFIEDCAVPLADLADYTDRLTRIFEKYGTHGTWYAHASVGCLHVRPVLNLKLEKDARTMRAIAEEAFAMVREYKGSHSGEHGDGLLRSEFHEAMFGPRLVRAFEAVKDAFDPEGRMNPGKIVHAPAMDDRRLFRYPPGYRVQAPETAFDWSAWGGLGGAVEMCNNNGACRKLDAGVMCPSYRVTRNERDLVRGRANTLRLALSGQLGPDALTSEEMAETLKLCVGCKACRRECPTGVDLARMKSEVLHQRARARGVPLRERLIAHLPRYAGTAALLAPLLNLRNRVPLLARLGERFLGFAAARPLPVWRRPFREPAAVLGPEGGREVVLLVDTFNRAFERENAEAALQVLLAAGYRVHLPRPTNALGRRPLCCGRTYLAAGMVDAAKAELARLRATLLPFASRGVPILGLEPSCLLTLRDEAPALFPDEGSRTLASRALLLEEFLSAESEAGRLSLDLRPMPGRRALLHGHCHQKSFGAMGAVERALGLVPGLEVETVASSCCGMAGAFGYAAETQAISLAMGELSLLPAVRAVSAETLVVADGTSCRHQIADGTGRTALHVARVLASALPAGRAPG